MDIAAQNLASRLQFFEEREATVVGRSHPFLRKMADLYVGADEALDRYLEARKEAREAFRQRHFQKANKFLDRAELYWRNYLSERISGAEAVVQVLKPVRNTALAAAATGGALLTGGVSLPLSAAFAVSSGAHAFGLSLPFSKSSPNAGALWPFAAEAPQAPPPPDAPQNADPLAEEEALAQPNRTDPSKKDGQAPAEITAAIDAPRPAHAKTIEEEMAQAIQATKRIQSPLMAKNTAAPAPRFTKAVTFPKIPTQNEWIAKAWQILEEWKADPKMHHPPGPFLIGTELLARADKTEGDWKNYLSKWQQLSEKIRQEKDIPEGNWQNRTARIMHHLYTHYLKDYTRRFALLIDHLDGKGGNCEDNTRLVLSTLLEQEIPFPQTHTLGIQIFDDHVQPVLFDRQKRGVWDLMSNRWKDAIEAPIYDPHLFYHAYLKKEGKRPPVKERDLLVAKATLKPKGFWARLWKDLRALFSRGGMPNSNLVYPRTGHLFSEDLPPPRADVPNPYPVGLPNSYSVLHVLSLETTDESFRRLSGEKVDKYGFGLFGGDPPSALVFRTEAEKRAFQQLTSVLDQVDFLIQTAARAYAPHWDDPDVQRGLLLLQHPSYFSRFPAEEIKDTFPARAQFESHWEYLISDASRFFRLPNIYNPFFPHLETENRLFSHIPLLALTEEAKTKLNERISKNPAAFIRFADRLPKEKRMLFIDWIIQSSDGLSHKVLAGVLGRRDRIGLKRKEPVVPPSSTPNWDVIEIELESPTLPPRQEEARHFIFAETMIAFILKLNEEEAFRRWDAELSNAFLAINQHGEWDRLFLNAEWERVTEDGTWYLDKKVNTVPNPFHYLHSFVPTPGRPMDVPIPNFDYTLSEEVEIPDHFLPIVQAMMERKTTGIRIRRRKNK